MGVEQSVLETVERLHVLNVCATLLGVTTPPVDKDLLQSMAPSKRAFFLAFACCFPFNLPYTYSELVFGASKFVGAG